MATTRKRRSATTVITLAVAAVGALGALLSGLAAAGAFGGHQPAQTSASSITPGNTPPPAGQAIPPLSTPAAVAGGIAARYSIDLASEYSIPLIAGGKPEPEKAGWLQADLQYSGGTFNSDGQLASLDAAAPTYASCNGDTRYTNFIQNPTHIGSTYCFTGHGVTAAIQVAAAGPMTTEPWPDYLTLTITVWQDS